jgi:hypothetical protein
MAKMHTIEITDGGDATAMAEAKVMLTANEFHADIKIACSNWTLDKFNWQDKKIVQSRKMRML